MRRRAPPGHAQRGRLNLRGEQRARRALERIGLSVSVTPTPGRLLGAAPSPTRGWIVEFAGPSGIGKSHLLGQVIPRLRGRWFFERDAKALVDAITEPDAEARYLAGLLDMRFARLSESGIPLMKRAEIAQRMCEVVRIGLAAKASALPRGVVLDDGVLHFFAQQIPEQCREQSREYLRNTVVILLLSREPRRDGQTEVYSGMREFVEDLGVPVLTLYSDAEDRVTNPDRVLDFLGRHTPHG